MKNIILILIVGMFLISLCSAWTWDNTKSFDKNLNKVTIKNSILGIPTRKNEKKQ